MMGTSPYIPGGASPLDGSPMHDPGGYGRAWHPSDYAGGAGPPPRRRATSFGAYARTTPEHMPGNVPMGAYGQPPSPYDYAPQGGGMYGPPPPLAGDPYGRGAYPPEPYGAEPYGRGAYGPPPPPPAQYGAAGYGAGAGAMAGYGRGMDPYGDEPPPLVPAPGAGGGAMGAVYGAGAYGGAYDRPGPYDRPLGPYDRQQGPYDRPPGPYDRPPGSYDRPPGPYDRAGYGSYDRPGYEPQYGDRPGLGGYGERQGVYGERPGAYADPRAAPYATTAAYGYDDPRGPPRPLYPQDDALDARRLRWQPNFSNSTDTRVLNRQTVQSYGVRLELHPFLRARNEPLPPGLAAEVGEEGHIRWDMRMRISSASFSAGPATRAWSRGRTMPATSPPTTDLLIVSRSFPWSIPVHDPAGITLGALMDTLDNALHQPLGQRELQSHGQETYKRVSAAYHVNRKELRGVLMDGLLRCDFLCERSEFGGFVQDDALVMERMHVPNYTTAISVICEPRGFSATGLPPRPASIPPPMSGALSMGGPPPLAPAM